MTDFQPPPRICPACGTGNLPLAAACRGCGADLRRAVLRGEASPPKGELAGGVAQERRAIGILPLLAVVALVVAGGLAALDLVAPAAGRPGFPVDHALIGGRPSPSAPSPSSVPSEAPSAAPSPTDELVRVGQPVELAGVETHTVLRVEDWPGPTPTAPGERYLAVEIQVQTLPGKTARFDQLYYTVENAAGVVRNAPQVGRQPALAYGVLEPGQGVIGWVSFLVPNPGPFTLNYRYPLGANGQTADEAVGLEPILPPTPEPIVPAGPSPGSTGLPNLGYPTALSSTNYAGYGAQLPGQSVTAVAGSWVQPAVHCSGKETSAVATWVGIDDGGLQDLEQIGTEAFCRAGTTSPTYLEWYEMYPQPQVEIRTIRAGDHFSATVTRRGSSWTLAIRDVTAKRSFTTRQTRTASAIQALWVIEAPARILANGELQILPLTSFGRVTMTACTAVAGGTRRAIGDARWAHYRFDMRTPSNVAKADTSSLGGGGSAFSSSWRHR